MTSVIFFKFKGARAPKFNEVVFDGLTISDMELKNLIAAKQGLDMTRDQLVLLHKDGPHKDEPYKPGHEFVRNTQVIVKREPLPPGLAARGRQQAAGEEQDLLQNPAFAAAQAAAEATAAIAAQSGAGEVQVDQAAFRDLEAKAAVDLAATAWDAQTEQNILHQRAREEQQRAAAAAGRGRGGWGRNFQHTGGPPAWCKFCGAQNAHFPDDCPRRNNPREDLRRVRAPVGIPASMLTTDEGGGLLLNSGKTAAVTLDSAEAAKTFAAMPAARRKALAAERAAQPALADRPHDASDDAMLQNLLLDIEPAPVKQEQQEQEQKQQQQQEVGVKQEQPPGEGDQQQQQEEDTSVAAAAAGAAAGTAGVQGFALFDDDEDLLPPLSSPQAAGGLNFGAGMELEQPPEQQQQLRPLGSPLVTKTQQQAVPPRSPLVQAMQEEVIKHGLNLADDVHEKLRYCSDILRPFKGWNVKDLERSFFEGKPLPPDDYEGVSTKYSRERQRHAAAEREQRERAVKQREREQCANGQALPDSRRAWEEGRDRSPPRDGPDSGGRLDRTRSRRERVYEREARDANRLLRKERERELRPHSSSRSRSRSRSRLRSGSPGRNADAAGSAEKRDRWSKRRWEGRDPHDEAGPGQRQQAQEREQRADAGKRQRTGSPAGAHRNDRDGAGAVGGDNRPRQPDLQPGQQPAADSCKRPDTHDSAAGAKEPPVNGAAAAAQPKQRPADQQPGNAARQPHANGAAAAGAAAAAAAAKDAAAAAGAGAGPEDASAPGKKASVFERLQQGYSNRASEPGADAKEAAAAAAPAAAAAAATAGVGPGGEQQARSSSRGRGSQSPSRQQQQQREQEDEEVLSLGDAGDEGEGGEGAEGSSGERGRRSSRHRSSSKREKKEKKEKKAKKHKKHKKRRHEDGDDRSHSRSRSRDRRRTHSRSRDGSSDRREGSSRPSKRPRTGSQSPERHAAAAGAAAAAAAGGDAARRSGRSVHDRLGGRIGDDAGAGGGGSGGRMTRASSRTSPAGKLGIWGGVIAKTIRQGPDSREGGQQQQQHRSGSSRRRGER